jgi:transposase-like protein
MSKPRYPGTIIEFVSQFHSEATCLDYLIKNRWGDGFVCPYCDHHEGWWLKKQKRFECAECHRQTSPLVDTLMHRSHLPVRTWFWAAYLVATHTPGMSALQLQRQLGLANAETAWFLLHRLREGMVRMDREPLSGCVEVDETYIGGPVKGKQGRGVANSSHKTLIAGAVEVRSYQTKSGKTRHRSGRVRLQILPTASAEHIQQFLNTNVVAGTTIKSDGWRGYSKKALKGYIHDRKIQGIPENAKELAPHIHRVFGNLQTWLNGTHHGVNPKYLQSYLNEFVFRFNRRDYPMAAFRSLLEILMTKKPLTLQQLKQP